MSNYDTNFADSIWRRASEHNFEAVFDVIESKTRLEPHQMETLCRHYISYILLRSITGENLIVPHYYIGAFWSMHLMLPKDYREFCLNFGRAIIPKNPPNPDPGSIGWVKHHTRLREVTLAFYQDYIFAGSDYLPAVKRPSRR